MLPERRSRTKQTGIRGTDEITSPSGSRRESGKVLFLFQAFSRSHLKPTASDSMIRIFSALVVSAFALLAASCCCTGEAKPPGLRPLPQFQEIQSVPAPAPEVNYEK